MSRSTRGRIRRLAVASLVAASMCAAVLTAPAHAGAGFFGSTGGTSLQAPVVGMAARPQGDGYWEVARDGGVFAFGGARFKGSMGGQRLNAPIVAIAAAPDGEGYWLVAADGGVFAFGSAPARGSLGGQRLAAPIVGIAVAPGGGLWLVAADGGVFAFGAPFLGSMGGRPLVAPIVAIVGVDQGYLLLGADGGVFAFNAPFLGSMGGRPLNAPIVGGAAHPGGGYWLTATDGGLFAFAAPFHGSTGGGRINRPVVGMASTPSGDGYWEVASDGGIFAFPAPPGTFQPPDPVLTLTNVVTGLTNPWDIAFTPDGTMLFTERTGRISALVGGAPRLLQTVGDVFVSGEAGLLGMAVDPAFASNRRIYTCHASTAGDVRVVAWTVDAGFTTAASPQVLVSGLPRNSSGRHSGCRPRFGPDGNLWIGTGDAADGTNPQDDASLGGKVLRVDKLTGAGVAGNLTGRIYTKGHRNVQGLAIRPGTSQVFSIEHGPDRDDEVTLLQAGGNSGWNPVPGYNENVPMTDTTAFPGAMLPTWRSGPSTIAPSGATFLSGGQWKAFEGALVMAVLKDMHLRALFLDPAGALVREQVILTGQGRLRVATQGPDGNLYVATDIGGGGGRIFKLTPG
jgi:glucose/arabinose dehydrogenase/ribosomal protein L24E